jgi:hypothetical protein
MIKQGMSQDQFKFDDESSQGSYMVKVSKRFDDTTSNGSFMVRGV